MGLTLNYKLRGPVEMTGERARASVAKMRAVALDLKRAGRIEGVGAISSAPGQFAGWSEWLMVPVPDEPHTTRGIEVPALAGFVFPVTLGKDCEPLRLGLCCYPKQVKDPSTGRTRAVRHKGWRLAGFCKTQFASLHGWEHFRRSHVTAVELLAGLSDLGIKVEINDEGGYWPGRDEAELRRCVDQMNGLVAAFAGAMKDAGDEQDGGPVHSPIFAHPEFERIEAEGMAREGKHVEQAVKAACKSKP